jgi:hypothetical protein
MVSCKNHSESCSARGPNWKNVHFSEARNSRITSRYELFNLSVHTYDQNPRATIDSLEKSPES